MSARSPVALDAGRLAPRDVLRQRGPVGVQVVDRGDRAVGADTDVVLAADVDRVVDVLDDVVGARRGPELFRNGMK